MIFEFSKRKVLGKLGLAKGLVKVCHNSEKLGRSRVFSFFSKEKLPYNQIFQSGRATAPFLKAILDQDCISILILACLKIISTVTGKPACATLYPSPI